ncbi:PQQ-binding-like beta-propeller repeat protein [Actinoplanes sp. NPDC049802]|uniref:outer membrane protein assembly factor BamB family protein n=1 Tax=Actinoplanes sp. NPDC049802 TaxID=3154742 RepID=UPI0033ED8655
MTVIELGDVSGVPADSPESAPRAEFRQGSVRRMALIGLALLCAVLLGASARPVPAGFRQLWSAPFGQNDTMAIRDDVVYVHRDDGGGARLTAYAVETGKVLWERDTGTQMSWLHAGQNQEVLLIPGDEQTVEVEFEDGSYGVEIFGGTVTAMDPATGERLWKHPGTLKGSDTGDTVLLHEYDRKNLIAIRLVRARDGSVVWERRLKGAETAMLQLDGTAPAHVVVLGAAGETTVLRYADGVTAAQRRLPWIEQQPTLGRGSSLSTATGLVLVNDNVTQRQGKVTAYRVGTLERAWERETAENPYVQDCGPVLCLGDGTNVVALDPASGAERWRRSGYPGVSPLPDDRVLISGTGEDVQQTLIHAEDGRVIGAGARGYVLHHDREADIMMLSLSLPPDNSRSVLRRLDLRTGRSVVLGVIPVAGDGFCGGDGRYVGCRDGDRITITDVG